jgi:uncharacterized protein DUF4265
MSSAMSPIETKRVKIYFELPEEEGGYPPDRVESLWAEQLGPRDFKIDNIPIYVRGIGSGDIVAAEPDYEGQLQFKELLQSSGNSVFRLYIFDEKEVPSLRRTLRGLGYESEQSHVPNLVAVEIPANKPIQPFLNLILKQAGEKHLEYQEAALRHQI